MKNFILIFFLGCFFSPLCTFGQTPGNKKGYAAEKYNLPPGAVLMPKGVTDVDYSYKLQESVNGNDSKTTCLQFLNSFKKDLTEIKNNFPKEYEYYAAAENYFNSLSDKVKVLFNAEELRYVYIFDQELKNKLTTVK